MRVERAGGGLGEHAGLGRRVAAGGDHRVGGEGDGGAQDGADIVRVGDLVEHDDEARVREVVEGVGGERRHLDGDALMHRLAAEQAVERRGRGLFRRQRESRRRPPSRRASAFGVASDAADLAARVGERRQHRMDAVDPRANPAAARRASAARKRFRGGRAGARARWSGRVMAAYRPAAAWRDNGGRRDAGAVSLADRGVDRAGGPSP